MSWMTRAAVGALVVLGMAAAACARRSDEAPDAGPSNARRIVSLGPATTEALFAIGAGNDVVGRSAFCDWPPEAAKLPAVGGVEPDVEAILALHPDLLVGPSGQWSARFAGLLHDHGVATWFPEEIRTLDGVDAMLRELGARTGRAAQAAATVASLDARELAVARAVAGAPRPRVLLVAGLGPTVVAGPQSFAGDMIERAGGQNVVAQGGAWPVLGFEDVVEADPDVVVDGAVAESGGVSRIAPGAPGWSGVRAVREGHVVPLTDERVLRPGPRVGEGLAVLARALHPDVSIP